MKNNLIGVSGDLGDTVGNILQYLDYEKNVMGGRTQYDLDSFPIKSSDYQIKNKSELKRVLKQLNIYD